MKLSTSGAVWGRVLFSFLQASCGWGFYEIPAQTKRCQLNGIDPRHWLKLGKIAYLFAIPDAALGP